MGRIIDKDLATPVDIGLGLEKMEAIDLQILLRFQAAKLYYGGAIDGVIGKMSEESLALYKSDAGLSADRFLDAATLSLLLLGYLPAEAPGAHAPMPADVFPCATVKAGLDEAVARVGGGASFGDRMLGPFEFQEANLDGDLATYHASILVRVHLEEE